MADAPVERSAPEPLDDAPGAAISRLVYESASTRVVRLRASGRVRKEAIGPDREERIRREREILKLVAGIDGVVHLRGDGGSRYALDLVYGGTSLAECIRAGRASLDDVLVLGEQLARVLASLHHVGVTHCDVCPSNILLGTLKQPWAPMLIDFDLAQAAAQQPARPSSGTLGYAAPEQSGRTARGVDHRTDLYALGATLYELATGKPCFEGTDPLQLMHDHFAHVPVPPRDVDAAIPPMLSDIILRLLAKEPDRRYDQLEQRVNERTAEIEKLQGELMASAHRAGMAQIATNVLHNVGNVLNSVTVAANRIKQRVFSSRTEGFERAAALMQENAHDLPRFIADDPRGRMLPKYLMELAPVLRRERDQTLHDIQALLHSVEHIGTVVRSQQTYAGRSWMKEPMPISKLLDQALSLNEATLHAATRIVREDDVATHVEADRARLLQILVNLIANANEAMADTAEKTLTLGAHLAGAAPDGRLVITVRDTGHGIAPENLSRLFSHGFTTKPEGHGFGLHSAATAAMEMGGKLSAHSDGTGRGATFSLEIPLHDVPGADARAA